MTGIIDIGSNTVRLVMYDKGKQLSNKGLNSEIIKDTKNGVLSEEGIEKLCSQLNVLKEEAGENKVYAFATYAVRVLKNKEEVKNIVFEKTNIDIDILSGEKEAEYDFIGLKSTLQKGESGIGADLGGGSCQIMYFENGNITFSHSYPIGCRRIKNKFVSGNFPTEDETKNIERYIKEQLKDAENKSVKKIYMMGGTAKTTVKLYSFLNGNENIDIIKKEKIKNLIDFIKETPPEVIKKILKNRYDNIVAGLIIMEQIAEKTGAEEIHIKKCGVRDGYLMKKEEMK